jgi:hypothetical protein
MVSEKHVFEDSENNNFDEEIVRLRSTLKGRIKLLNKFEKALNPNYSKVTMKGMGVDINDKEQILEFMEHNNKYIEQHLIPNIKKWVTTHGTKWHRERMFGRLK